MQISSVSQISHAALAASASKSTGRIALSQVSASVRQRADDDGDGKTGVAALNDGDAAAKAAQQQVAATGGVDIRV